MHVIWEVVIIFSIPCPVRTTGAILQGFDWPSKFFKPLAQLTRISQTMWSRYEVFKHLKSVLGVRICAHFEDGPCSLVWVPPWGLSKQLIFFLRKFTNKLNERLQCVWRRIINQWRVVIASSCLKAHTLFHLLVEARNTDHGCWATSLAPDPAFRGFKAKQPQFNDYILTVYENICAL